MNWHQDFEDDLAWVFNEAETVIRAFPAPLNTIGLTYLNEFNVLKAGSTNNYICYLLPFWLMDILSIDRVTCRRLSLANVFGMLYFFIQDDQMDSISPSSKTQLPLANLLHIKFLDSYLLIFPAATMFWPYYSTYVMDWAEAVTNEDQAHYFVQNPLLIARKASPLKLCSTSACLLSEQGNLIPILSNAVDLVLATIQMADDWCDWQDDLNEGNYNSLLDFIQSQTPIMDGVEFNLHSIKQALYVKGMLQSYAQIAIDQHQQLVSLNIPIPQLILFHAYIVNSLVQEAAAIENDRVSLVQGGFQYWISKNRE